MQFRYQGLNRFFKGNTHVHTTASDGAWTPDEAIARYRDAGYDFLAVTDHNAVTRLADRSTDSFCLIDSVEIDDDRQAADWRTTHVVCVGVGPTFPDRGGYRKMLKAARADRAILCLAHPHWSGNSLAQMARGPWDGVELFNGVTWYHNRKESGVYLWDEILRTGRDLLGFAADDNHGKPADQKVHDLGWIMVAAERLDRDSVLAAIRAGRFYSSTGPTIRSVQVAGDKLVVDCSPAQHLWLLGPAWFNKRLNCPPGKPVEHHEFDLSFMHSQGAPPYLRLEIQDERGGRAWTNKLLV